MPEPAHPSSADPRARAALEKIPHLVEKICATWGSPELDAYLSRLLMDSRDGKRRGLPADIADEVLFLAHENKARRALEMSWRESVSFAEAFRRIDEGDQGRLKIDAFDDPTVSHDTIVARGERKKSAASDIESRADDATDRNQAQGLGELALMLVRSKWVIGALLLFVGVRYVLPYVRPLF